VSDEKSMQSVFRRLRTPAIVILLAFCVAAIGLAWQHHRLSVALAEEETRLVNSMAESALAVGNNGVQTRVALFDAGLDDGSATKDLKRILAAESAFVWKTVTPTDIQAGRLEGFDVAIFPGGFAPKQAEALGSEGQQAVREFVQAGGGYVGICGGAFLATSRYDWGMALVNAKPLTGKIDVPGKGTVSMTARGAGTVKMDLTDAGRRVLGDASSLLDVRYSGGPILSRAEARDLPEFIPLAVFRTEVWEYEPQRGTMIGTPAIIAGRFGNGRVILFSPHPEMTPELHWLVRRAILATARTHLVQEKTGGLSRRGATGIGATA
jgi:glutamine amidotransferase-like uncharacterized protein